MAYKIEGLIKGMWHDDAVGSENSFETYEEAAELLPILARNLECDVNELRIVES